MSDNSNKPKKDLLDRTWSAASKATGMAKDLVDMAQETAKSVVEVATDTARSTLLFTAESAQTLAELAGGGAKLTAQLALDTGKAATQLAQETALQMVQAYFRNTTLTVALSESKLNKQLRQMAEGHDYLDYVTLECGDDRLTVKLDGHYKRAIYTLSLDFAVLECKVSDEEQFLLVRHVDSRIDVQLREAKTLTNFVLRRLSKGTTFVANRIPERFDPAQLFLAQLDGIKNEGPALWRVDLHKNLLMELLHNRSWIIDKLLTLTEVIPGLSLLIDSEEMLQKLANQFEIRSLRVRPSRFDILIGINT